MILVDANILLYAEDSSSLHHTKARQWWDGQLSGDSPIYLCWPVILAYMRIATNARVFEIPLTTEEASQRVQSWLNQPCTRIAEPTSRHWEILKETMRHAQTRANLVMDAHLAALAKEHGLTLYSTDYDFARFPGLKWKNPI